MGFLRFFDETVNFFVSDIRKQTGKGFFETFTDKGNYGEFLSYKNLINTPGKRDYIHNCYVPTSSGCTEIDFILLHETGIYVVESKNYSGWIFGDELSKHWTQVMAGGRTKNRFFNPVLQNAGHIKALKTFLKDYPDLRFYSLIVFSERCELKKVSCSLPDTYIVKRDALKSVFRRQIKERDKIPEKTLYEIGCLLKPHCFKTAEEKDTHIARIKALQVGKPAAMAEPIAPLEAAAEGTGESAMLDEDESLVIDAATAAEIEAFERAAENAGETAEESDDESEESVGAGSENEFALKFASEAFDPEAAIPFVEEAVQAAIPSIELPIELPEPASSAVPAQPASMICPRCQRPLIQRAGKNGPFIGCTGYPRCRYTSSL